MKIIRCDDTLAGAWDAFVASSPHASFYHRYAWRAINERQLGHRSFYLAAMDGSRVAGIFPIVQVKSRLFGNLACSMPFVNYGGPCAESPEVERLLLAEARKVCDETGVTYLEIRSRRDLGPELPSLQSKVSLGLTLDRDPETLWKAFKTGHRQEIRRGYKHGITARIGGAELLDPFYDVLSESWHVLGTPLYRKDYFAAILAAFPRETRVVVVMAGDEPAGAAFDGLQGDTVEGMWLGSRLKFRHQLAGYVLYWELIKDACERGFAHFHLGRSSVDSGGETFKKKWNASVTQLYWHYLLRGRSELPQLNVHNPKYQLAIDTWRRLPLSVIQRVGPYIARSIP
jgi:FemAB-related protein (PEP-CTERM system-associated)